MMGLTQRRAALPAMLGLMLLAGCGTDRPASPADIAGQNPVGAVKVVERIEGGKVSGSGEFRFQGYTYNFTITGKLLDPGEDGVISAEGGVYPFPRLESFTGRYIQVPGPLGYRGEPSTDLWLRNQENVIIRLRTRDYAPLPQMGRAELYFPQLN